MTIKHRREILETEFEGGVDEPKPITLQERDMLICQFLYALDGFASLGQIVQMFFNNPHTGRGRMGLLKQHDYVLKLAHWSSPPVFYLGERGAQLVAKRFDIPWNEFLKTYWVLDVDRDTLAHDLMVRDFRLGIQESATRSGYLKLAAWIWERQFITWHDEVSFKHQGAAQTVEVAPDSYCEVLLGKKRFRFLYELERTNHKGNPEVVRRKLKPFVAYIRSKQYAERFDYNAGRILYELRSKQRLKSLQQVCEQQLGNATDMFYFTTTPLREKASVLTDPIWYRGTADKPAPLFVEEPTALVPL